MITSISKHGSAPTADQRPEACSFAEIRDVKNSLACCSQACLSAKSRRSRTWNKRTKPSAKQPSASHRISTLLTLFSVSTEKAVRLDFHLTAFVEERG